MAALIRVAVAVAIRMAVAVLIRISEPQARFKGNTWLDGSLARQGQ